MTIDEAARLLAETIIALSDERALRVALESTLASHREIASVALAELAVLTEDHRRLVERHRELLEAYRVERRRTGSEAA
jgi:hypothetical protein